MRKLSICLFLCSFIFLSSCTEQIQKDEYTFYAMDTMISIALYNEKESKSIAKEVENIYLKYDTLANDYKNTNSSSIYTLNQNREITINEELKELLLYSLEVYEETHHYFNPFIGRLSHLWKDALNQNKLVDDKIIQKEINIMNQTALEIKDDKARLLGEGNIDLGGIAKGFATSKAVEFLASVPCEKYLLNAGNSTIALGNKMEKPFKVGISKALDSGYLKILNLKDCIISTSSIKEQHTIIDGKYYSHLLNPMTGYPADYYDSISIIGQDARALDAYSTACFAMELDEVKQFLDHYGVEYILSKGNQILYYSKGVDSYA